jgi:hypothetical protein
MAARGINDTDWTSSMFVVKNDSGSVKITVPKNIEVFSDSLLMMSILKICEIKGYQPVLSENELPKSVLETKEGAFFAGYVLASTRHETGEMNSGSSKFAKGEKAFQTYSVEKAYGKARHLKTGGQAKLTERLSAMKGFTQAYWGLRGSVVALFKSLRPSVVTNLETYVLSKNELLKNVKTKLQCENGGCFRSEELMYLSNRYSNAKASLNAFLARLDNPTEDLAKRFDEVYAPVKTIVDRADSEIKANLASRARILFPQDKKKATVQWSKKPLSEKLQDLDEEKKLVFKPESLPGITVTPVVRKESDQLETFLEEKYDLDDDEPVRGVVFSWYTNFEE